MSTQTRVRHAHRGLRVGYALSGGIAAWLAHLVFASSFVRYTCTTHGVSWVQHLVTAVCVAITLHAMSVAWGLLVEGRAAPEDAGTPAGSNHFLGLLGLLFGAANLLLILGEGSYVILIHPACRT